MTCGVCKSVATDRFQYTVATRNEMTHCTNNPGDRELSYQVARRTLHLTISLGYTDDGRHTFDKMPYVQWEIMQSHTRRPSVIRCAVHTLISAPLSLPEFAETLAL